MMTTMLGFLGAFGASAALPGPGERAQMVAAARTLPTAAHFIALLFVFCSMYLLSVRLIGLAGFPVNIPIRSRLITSPGAGLCRLRAPVRRSRCRLWSQTPPLSPQCGAQPLLLPPRSPLPGRSVSGSARSFFPYWGAVYQKPTGSTMGMNCRRLAPTSSWRNR